MGTESTTRSKTRRSDRFAPAFISTGIAARLTGTTPKTWRNWAKQRKFVSVRLGKRILVPIRELERLLSEGTCVRVDEPVSPVKQQEVNL
ncbi:MAG: helix-turn-helix domain-containing protein [Terracidiphilus sp.]